MRFKIILLTGVLLIGGIPQFSYADRCDDVTTLTCGIVAVKFSAAATPLVGAAAGFICKENSEATCTCENRLNLMGRHDFNLGVAKDFLGCVCDELPWYSKVSPEVRSSCFLIDKEL